MLSKEELEEYSRIYYSLVFRFCYTRLLNKADAEDVTQETFVVFSEKGHLLDPEYVQPWLLTTAHHKVLKEYRRRSHKNDGEIALSDDMHELNFKVSTFEDDLVDFYMERFIDEIYSRLNEREKELFNLCCDGNIKTAQIAQIMGLEPHACSMRKKRLKERCREIMLDILFY